MFGNNKVPFNKTALGKKEFKLEATRLARQVKQAEDAAKADLDFRKDSRTAYNEQFFAKSKQDEKIEGKLKEFTRIKGLVEDQVCSMMADAVVESLRLEYDYMTAHKARLHKTSTELFKGLFTENVISFADFELATNLSGRSLISMARDTVFSNESGSNALVSEAIAEQSHDFIQEASQILLHKLVATVSSEKDTDAHLRECVDLPRHLLKKKEKDAMTFWKATNIFVAKRTMGLVSESMSEEQIVNHNENNIVESMVLFSSIQLLETVGVVNPSKILMNSICTTLVNSK